MAAFIRILQNVVWGLLSGLLLSSCLFSKIDKTPYQQTPFYHSFRQLTDTLHLPIAEGKAIQAGWAKANITPHKRVRLAGYGTRFGKKSSGIHDSLFMRAFVFDNGTGKAALLTADLLIMPPEVVKQLKRQLPALGWNINQLYFSATHTHNSTGGWAKHLSGSLIAGKYRRNTVKSLTLAYLKVLREAEKKQQPAAFAFARTPAPEFVQNRLSDTSHLTDPWLRTLFIRQASGKTAVLTTFQAHPTCLDDKQLLLSGDYPNALTDSLEKSFDFAAFCAGGVGSHAPNSPGADFEKMAAVAGGLAAHLRLSYQTADFQTVTQLRSFSVPLPLRKPVWRISRNPHKQVRPWLFYLLFGKYGAEVRFLQVGGTVFVGMPCDFSGLLTPPLETQALLSGRHLVINSFNGGYVGYITPDEYYNSGHYETKDMNWFGPENGAYVSEVILKILGKW